jgi:hypothetical protein
MGNIKLDLILEKGKNFYSGRTIFETNLLVKFAETISEVEEKIRASLKDTENINPEKLEFQHILGIYESGGTRYIKLKSSNE